MTSVGVRFDEDMLKRLEKLSKEENADRSTIIRKLVEEGYEKYMTEKAFDKYKRGVITLSRAAKIADKTIWEMKKYMAENGYSSSYSIKDLERETENLEEL